LLLVLLLVLFVKGSSNNRPEATGLENLIRQSYAPLQSGVEKLRRSLNSMGIALTGSKELEKRIHALEIENDSLSLENMQLREAKVEVERLRELLAYKEAQQDQYDLEAARVVARSPNNWYQAITIDKGTENEISIGMPVITPAGLVGRIVSVGPKSSQVWLITDREMAVGAILQVTRESKGIVEGMGNDGTLRMINIPYYSAVTIGEKVVSSGLSETYPPGIQIGIIADVERESNGLVLSATVTPSVDFNKLEEVLVIKKFRVIEPTGRGGI
jgi:rod shape-determining protein MreC